MPNNLTLRGASSDFQLIEAETSPGDSSGKPKAKKFSIVGYTGGLMRLEGVPHPVVIDLEGMAIPRQQIPALYAHDRADIVGHTTKIDKTQKRLYLEGVLSGHSDTEQTRSAMAAREVVRLAGNGFDWQASIGATKDDYRFVPQGESVKANGLNFTGPLYLVSKSTLAEISFVAVGADMNTSASVAASGAGAQTLNGRMTVEFTQWLAAKGIDQAAFSALSEAVQGTLKAAHAAELKASQPQLPAGTQSIDSIVAAQERENERQSGITRIVAESIQFRPELTQYFGDLGRAAIKAKMAVNDFELQCVRERRVAPHVHIPQGEDAADKPDVIEAAICQTAKLENLEKRFDARTLEAAHRKFRGNLGLLDLLRFAASRNGWHGHSVKSDLPGALRAAFYTPHAHELRAAGPSTYSLSGILSNVANKFVQVGFESIESAWRAICAIRNVSDFKEITSYSLTGDLTYEQVAPGGELKHGSLGERSYGNRADTYGKLISIDRRDWINDDLGALTTVGRRLGRGGALKLNSVIWTEWQDDSAFFPTDGSLANYDAGVTDSLLTAAGLDNATTIFKSQTDPDGNPLGTMPRILLTPVALEGSAMTLMTSQQLNLVTATTATSGNANIWAGRYCPVSSMYLSNALAWYLLADPNDLPAIEVCFLNGVEVPTIETADAEIDRLGVTLRGYHDFGARKQEYRAAVKMKGAA